MLFQITANFLPTRNIRRVKGVSNIHFVVDIDSNKGVKIELWRPLKRA